MKNTFKLTAKELGIKPVTIHLEINEHGTRLKTEGEFADTIKWFAICVRMHPRLMILFEATKEVLVTNEKELDALMKMLTSGNPTI